MDSHSLLRGALAQVAEMLSASRFVPWRLRSMILRAAGADVAPSAQLRRGASGIGPNVHVGRETFIHRDLLVQGSGAVWIGDRVAIGPRCTLTTATHDYDDPARRGGKLTYGPIRIGDGCWLGTSVVVIAGVTIGHGCLIAAGAVVIGDCSPHGLYAGVPARRVRDLPGKTASCA